MYGHIETMANAVAEGARSINGVEVVVKRVPDVMSEEVARTHGSKVDQAAPIASPKELDQYDGIIFGTPTGLETWPRKCATSSIKPAACG